MKLQKNEGNGNHFITIPEQLRKAKGFEKGDDLKWKVNDKGRLEIFKK